MGNFTERFKGPYGKYAIRRALLYIVLGITTIGLLELYERMGGDVIPIIGGLAVNLLTLIIVIGLIDMYLKMVEKKLKYEIKEYMAEPTEKHKQEKDSD